MKRNYIITISIIIVLSIGLLLFSTNSHQKQTTINKTTSSNTPGLTFESIVYPVQISNYAGTIWITDYYNEITSTIIISFDGKNQTGTYSLIRDYKHSIIESETGGWIKDDWAMYEYYTDLQNNTSRTFYVAHTGPYTPTIELWHVIDPIKSMLFVEVPQGFRWKTYGEDTITGTLQMLDSTHASLDLDWVCFSTDTVGKIVADITIYDAYYRTLDDQEIFER